MKIDSSLLWALALVPVLASPTEAQSRRRVVPVPPEPVQADSLQELVRATFDPAGPFDDAGYAKGAGAPAHDRAAADAAPPAPPPPLAGGPANELCGSATVIPGNTVTYDPPLLFTGGALTELCEGATGCESGGVGTSNSVWWEYTPDQDGTIIADTFGSNYDTVLSVFDGCGIFDFINFQCIATPNELACSDDYFFGNTSQVILPVQAGLTYKIKVASVGQGAPGGLLDFNLRYLPPNDACTDATTIPGTVFAPPLLSTQWATVEPCEAVESCEFNGVGVSNTVWYSFLAPCDGLVSVNTNGTDYDTVLSIFDGCGVFVGVDQNCQLPAEIACDDDSGTGLASQLLDVPVQGGFEYRIKVSDYNPTNGGGTLDFHFLFTALNPPSAQIDSPADFECLCSSKTVTGTASTGSDPLAEWRLEYRPMAGGVWIEIAAGTSAVNNGTLASWNTSALAAGYYLLRLTVENGCGFANTDARVVFVDKAFDDLELRSPQGGVFGGRVPVDGTAWDNCFSDYRVEYRAQGAATWTVHLASTTAVIDDPLVPGGWDTTALPDGTYELRVSAQDQCGTLAQTQTTVELDNTPPVARIDAPADCAKLGGTVAIVGTADDQNLASWRLEYTGGGSDAWVLIASGNTPVVNGTLGSWNVGALPPCSYTLRLSVVSQALIDGDDPASAQDWASVTNRPVIGYSQ